MNYKQRYQAVENLVSAIHVVINASQLSQAMKAYAVAEVLKDKLAVVDLIKRNRLKE